QDPLQLGVVSFVFGIPPNALEGIGELFAQYAIHLGDQARNRAHDRYPLHVFRDAAEAFDEPHSPLTFQFTDDLAQELLAAARELWGQQDGSVRLDIRELDEQSADLAGDWNLYVELTEKVLHFLVRSPKDAEKLFKGGRFADLQRLYNSRKFRAAETWGPQNGHAGKPAGNGKAQGEASWPAGGPVPSNDDGQHHEETEGRTD
ncbi:MAG TPA: hypothetical protein VE078_03100, partial [Thermoanaerobaculia bacterium]|nr:hypothetical protein [Thermoanaerobaculia bacterium]